MEKTIAARLRVPVLAFGLLLGCLLGAMQYRTVSQHNLELSAAMSQYVEQYLGNAEGVLQALALQASRSDEAAVALAMQAMLQAVPLFERLVRLDAQGVVLSGAPPEGLLLPQPGRQLEASARVRVATRPRVSPATGNLVVEVECSIPGGGAMVGALSLEALTGSMRSLVTGGDDLLLLTDEAGAIMVQPPGLQSQGEDNIGHWPAFQRAKAGEGSLMLQRMEDGFCLTVARELSPSGWVLLVSRPLVALLRPAVLALAVYLASVALLYVVLRAVIRQEMARRVTAPLQAFAEAIRALGVAPSARQTASLQQGSWTFEELAGLAEAVARMAQQVQERETALRESETRYRTMYENAIEGIFRVNPQGVMLDCNPALARMFGYVDEADVLRSVPTVALAYADLEHRAIVLESLYKEGQITGLELPMLRKDGSSIWVMVNAVAVYDEAGALECIEGMLTDITPRKRTEAELEASQEFFRTVFEGIHEGLVVQDADSGRILDVNKRACEMFGYSYQGMLGLDVQQISLGEPPYSLQEAWDHLRRAREQGAYSFEWLSRRKSGELFWSDVTLSFATFAGAARYIATIRDISERKHMELARREAEARYRELVHNAPVGIFSSSLEGLLLSANPEIARMLGYATPEELQAEVLDLGANVYVDARDRVSILDRLMQHGSVHAHEVRFKRKDGSWFWCSLTARLVRNEEGIPLHIEGFQMDVTSRKDVEAAGEQLREQLEQLVAERTKELRQANARLLELDRLKTSFLSSASHELRTPLTSILGFAKLTGKMFRRHFLAGEEAAGVRQHGERISGNLEIIAKEGARLSRLVNDLLDINAIESGMMAWRDTDVDLRDVLEQAVASARGMLPASGRVRLDARFPEALPPLRIDHDKILQVLQNLLNNAVKFTMAGEIRVEARLQAGPAETAAVVEICVEDTGQGIPAASLETIFEKFYQIVPEGRDEEKPRGTGLGLAICKEIVEHYGGRIWAESILGAGSTFIVQLPVQRELVCLLPSAG